MKTFEDIINEHILNELGGFLGAVKNVTTDYVKGQLDKGFAAVGSKKAKEKNNLRNITNMLNSDFRSFCKDRKIDMRIAAMEDFLEFLKQNVGFNYPDSVFNKLAYGNDAAKESPNRGQIALLYDTIEEKLSRDETIETEIDQMIKLAEDDPADRVSVQKALWGLAREHPAQISDFRAALRVGLVGKLIGNNYGVLINKIAGVVAKHSKTGATGKEGKKAGRPDEIKIDPSDIYVGERRAFKEIDLKQRSRLLGEELAIYNLDFSKLNSTYDKMEKSKFDPAAFDKISKFYDKQMSVGHAINASRILLQLFRGKTDELTPLFSTFKAKDVGSASQEDGYEQQFKSQILQALTGRVRDSRDSDTPEKVYDASEFNSKLMTFVKDEVSASRLFVITLYCVGKAGMLP